ncbi:GNAT family N-acetyltransferase [Herbaspirillum rubrisubalbicans Os34]|uniref:GNAT family N-acetyltransferase n=1 Tax=Herbaspirillum rubrisubalbicans Os34 TaxID=1235827 RepID=A0A6M3ZVR9_9BURK|nr:GNAT family N-acetyltransferase [Herbaspirillum rubrisubalbicans]QJQ02343.1 GNAT family N-acetyltransferase [Herbaspirillum rubrisubalbicans Os34]
MQKKSITIDSASSEDFEFARQIVFSEMRPYYTEARIDWSDVSFEEGWKFNRGYIVYIEDSRVGYFSIRTEKNFLYIQDMHVLKDYRNKGVGRFAINFIIDLLLTADITEIRLKVFKNNSAVKFYERLGFTKVFSDPLFFGMEYRNSLR